MTEEELKEFEKELSELTEELKGQLEGPPRYVLTGEIIPKSLLKRKRDMNYSEERLKKQK